eukprot:759255-Rhodomonas_salina.2
MTIALAVPQNVVRTIPPYVSAKRSIWHGSVGESYLRTVAHDTADTVAYVQHHSTYHITICSAYVARIVSHTVSRTVSSSAHAMRCTVLTQPPGMLLLVVRSMSGTDLASAAPRYGG